MVISIESVVWFVLYTLGAGAIFGLLLYLIKYVEGTFPEMALFCKFARIGLVILAILVLISIILAFMGHPIISLR